LSIEQWQKEVELKLVSQSSRVKNFQKQWGRMGGGRKDFLRTSTKEKKQQREVENMSL